MNVKILTENHYSGVMRWRPRSDSCPRRCRWRNTKDRNPCTPRKQYQWRQHCWLPAAHKKGYWKLAGNTVSNTGTRRFVVMKTRNLSTATFIESIEISCLSLLKKIKLKRDTYAKRIIKMMRMRDEAPLKLCGARDLRKLSNANLLLFYSLVKL